MTGGAAAEFKKMSALSGIKSTPLCSEKDGIRLERIVFFYCERLISYRNRLWLHAKEQRTTLHIPSVPARVVYPNQKREGVETFFPLFLFEDVVSPVGGFQR